MPDLESDEQRSDGTTEEEYDPMGRFEVGFPLRWWPNDVMPVPGVDLRWVNDSQLARIVESVNDRYPVYRSVYRFTHPERDRTPKERRTAIVSHAFWEFECQPCGRLCEHTMLSVRQFGHWLRRNRMTPQVIYSGGKSLHIYVHTERVNLQYPHETIRAVCNQMVKKARVKCWDPAANLALSQIARVPNALNPKSGLYAIPVPFDDVVRRPPSYILERAREPRPMSDAPAVASPQLAQILAMADERLSKRLMVESLLPPPMPKVSAEGCVHFQRVLDQGVTDGDGRHFALVAVIDYYRLQGFDKYQCRQAVEAWNVRNRPPLSPGVIGYQVDAQYKRDLYPPCAILRQRGLHPKEACKK